MGAHDRSGTYPVTPAPSGPGIRKPRCQQDDPVLLAAERQAANVLDAWMRARGESNVSLARAWGISESIVRDLRTRHRPLTVGRILLLPRGRARSALFDLLDKTEIDTSSAA